MPKVWLKVGAAEAHCTQNQVTSVAQQLAALDSPQSRQAVAAATITCFVEETHAAIAQATMLPLSDLRHGTVCLRRAALQHLSDKAERDEALALLKSLDRLSVTAAELRHFSRGRLMQLAGSTTALVDRLNPWVVETSIQDEYHMVVPSPIVPEAGSVEADLMEIFGEHIQWTNVGGATSPAHFSISDDHEGTCCTTESHVDAQVPSKDGDAQLQSKDGDAGAGIGLTKESLSCIATQQGHFDEDIGGYDPVDECQASPRINNTRVGTTRTSKGGKPSWADCEEDSEEEHRSESEIVVDASTSDAAVSYTDATLPSEQAETIVSRKKRLSKSQRKKVKNAKSIPELDPHSPEYDDGVADALKDDGPCAYVLDAIQEVDERENTLPAESASEVAVVSCQAEIVQASEPDNANHPPVRDYTALRKVFCVKCGKCITSARSVEFAVKNQRVHCHRCRTDLS